MDHISLPTEIILKNGRRATLRKLRESDAEEICRALPIAHRDSDFLAYLPGEFNLTIEQELDYIREHNKNPRAILLCAEEENRLAAFCGAKQVNFRRHAHQAEIGITVLKEFWGLGVGRALTQALVHWARDIGLRKLTLRVFDDNHRAIALYRSLGFIDEGRLRGDVLRVDGRYSDTIIMGLDLVGGGMADRKQPC